MRKLFLLLLAGLLFTDSAEAQLSKSIFPSPAFTESLSKITTGYSNNFYSIQGEQLVSQDDMDTYRSTVSIPGAKLCIIYRFHSSLDSTASWQGILYEGDSHAEALKIYKNTCRLVQKSKVKLYNNSSAAFTGKTDEPDANLRFVSSIFRLSTKDAAYERFYAEVELINTTFDQWEVHLNLQQKKDDMER